VNICAILCSLRAIFTIKSRLAVTYSITYERWTWIWLW